MFPIKYLYNLISGKKCLSTQNQKLYQENIFPSFQEEKDKFLFFDDKQNQVLLMTIEEMMVEYHKKNYCDYDLGKIRFDDFCCISCIEVLKWFNDYNVEQIGAEFSGRDILKDFLKR